MELTHRRNSSSDVSSSSHPVEALRDDTFVVINNNFVDEFHEHLNSIHSDIQFTMKKEKKKQVTKTTT